MHRIIGVVSAAIVVALVASMNSSRARAQWVVIDPGHGGPGARKYGCNGGGYNEYRGSFGPVDTLTEQWVNLQVSLRFRDLLESEVNQILLTREQDTANIRYWDRVNMANYAIIGIWPANAFVSVHHNGLPLGKQGTEVWWSSIPNSDSAYTRESADSTLAMKAQLKLVDEWKYKDRCAYARQPIGTPTCSSAYCCNHCCVKSGDPPTWDCCGDTVTFDHRESIYFVLRNTICAAALSEASNLHDTTEEQLFDLGETHLSDEADAICRAVYSYLINAGIAVVRNSYSGGNSGSLIVWKFDWYIEECFEPDTVSSPYTACWLGGMFGEGYCLDAITPQVIGGHERAFNHWAHLDDFGSEIETHYDPHWQFEVPYFERDYHRYVAYFSGGPYSAQVDSPNGYENWRVGEQRNIVWDASVGADSTTLINVFLDRDGGNGGYPEHLVTDRPVGWGNHFTWTVTGPYATHCRVKVVAEDIAGNFAEDVSNQDFTISQSGNNNPVIDSPVQCRYPSDECRDCIKYGEQVTVEVLAHDPDGDSIFYEWWCYQGYFAENGQKRISTAENYVTYVAPAKGRQGEETLFDDAIIVAVTDVRGGQSWKVGYPELHDQEYTCMCGDVDDNLMIDLADVLCLIAYLYHNGPPPVDPFERGDANNDCLIDLGDAMYIINYLYSNGPYPECCWFPPNE
jgi:hypothetical protein